MNGTARFPVVDRTRPVSMRQGLFSNYLFVDYATQGYGVFATMLVLLFHNGTVPGWEWLITGHLLLMGAIHGLIEAGSRRSAPAWLAFLRGYYPILLYTAYFCETGLINRMFFTHYLDAYFLRVEQSLLGFQPSVQLMELLPYRAVSEVFYAAYFSYYLMIAGVGLALFLRDRKQFFHYVSVVSFVFYVCYAVYVILPVIGPRILRYPVAGFAVPDEFRYLAPAEPYPEAVTQGFFFQLMRWVYSTFESPGSAIPSSHVAIALTTVYFSFLYLRRIRHLHLVLAGLLCLSTIYCGYHYFIDVVAGLLTTAVLVPVGNWLYSRDGLSGGSEPTAARAAPKGKEIEAGTDRRAAKEPY